MVSKLKLVTKDGIKNAYVQDGVLVAPGSKFDGIKATESNLKKALFSSNTKKTNLNNYRLDNKQATPMQTPVQTPMNVPMPRPATNTNMAMNNKSGASSMVNKNQRKQLMDMAMLGKLGLI